MKDTFNFYSDAGHGWIAVKHSDLKELKIADKISSYSYQRGLSVYLEEDCDMQVFFEAFMKKFRTRPKLVVKSTDGRSPIRSYERYVHGTQSVV